MSGVIPGGALFSEDGLYRYRLWREWSNGGRRCVFVGVNPSTADAVTDDHTIRKCVGFAQRWGFGAIDMVNLFAWVDTDQRGLLRSPDPVGPDNDPRILQTFDTASRIVFAWGSGKTAAVRKLITARIQRDAQMLYGYRSGIERGSLGETDDGYARHPLMLAYATRFEAIEKKSSGRAEVSHA